MIIIENEIFKLFIKQYAMKRKLVILYLLIISFIITSTAISLLTPTMQGQVIDDLSHIELAGTFVELFEKVFVFLGLLLISYIIIYLQKYVALRISEEIAADLRQNIHDKLGSVDPSVFKDLKFSEVIVKVDKDVSLVKQCGITSIIALISNVATIAVIIPRMFWIHKGITISIVILFLCIPVISNKFGTKIKKCSDEVLQGYNCITNILNESYNNWIIVRLFQCYGYIHKRYFSNNQRYKNKVNHQNYLYTVNLIITVTIQFIVTSIIWLAGAKGIFDGIMTIGTIMTLLGYQNIVMGPILDITSFTNDYHTSLAALDDIYKFLNYRDLENNTDFIQEPIKTVSLENVSFRYDDTEKYILKNINCQFECNKIYAILGKSGQGKSTLFKLLAGVLEPVKGETLVNGLSLKKIDRNQYWSKIGYVMQNSVFFEDSVIQNVNLANMEAFEQVVNVCQEIDILDDVNNLQQGWETLLKTSPRNFSEGQFRRLDIARNILKLPQFLIFDEATSNIDEKRREQFYELLHKVSKDKIIIITTHNQNELIHADVVYKLNDEGLIVSDNP